MTHEHKVVRIVEQLAEHRGQRPLSLHKRSVSHQVPKAHDQRHHDAKIDVGDLTAILSIDPVRRICVAESGVTFVQLVRETLKYGLVPIVVPSWPRSRSAELRCSQAHHRPRSPVSRSVREDVFEP